MRPTLRTPHGLIRATLKSVDSLLSQQIGTLDATPPGLTPLKLKPNSKQVVDKVFGHLKQVLDQVYDLYQQYGPDEEYFRVTGVNDIQKFNKGRGGREI